MADAEKKTVFERCKALTQEDKDRNLESEELDIPEIDWDGEQIEDAPSQLEGLIIDTRDTETHPEDIVRMNMMRPKPSYTAIELLVIGSKMSASNFFLRREGQATTRRF